MRITVLGAGGRTGHLLVDEALARGHDVRAFLRDPAKLAAEHARLEVVAGDALDAAAVSAAVSGADAVLSALGASADGSGPVYSASAERVIAAMREHGVRRLVVISAQGAGDEPDDGLAMPLRVFRWALPEVVRDMGEMERLVRASGLDWTIVHPGGLSDAPRGGYRVVEGPVMRGGLRTPRGDLAEAMVRAADEGLWIRTTISVAV